MKEFMVRMKKLVVTLYKLWPMAFALGIGGGVVASWFFDGLIPFFVGAIIGAIVGFVIDERR